MDNKNPWDRVRDIAKKSADQLEKEVEQREKLSEESIIRERLDLEAREKQEAILNQPAKIWVSKKQLTTFLSKGELSLGSLNFGERVLNIGDILVLMLDDNKRDENNKEWPVELVSIEKTKLGNDRVKVKKIENLEEINKKD